MAERSIVAQSICVSQRQMVERRIVGKRVILAEDGRGRLVRLFRLSLRSLYRPALCQTLVQMLKEYCPNLHLCMQRILDDLSDRGGSLTFGATAMVNLLGLGCYVVLHDRGINVNHSVQDRASLQLPCR